MLERKQQGQTEALSPTDTKDLDTLNDLQRKVYASLVEAMNKVEGPGITKKQLSQFAHCAVGYISNLDSKGQGVEGAFYVGRKKVYPKEQACLWIARRARRCA